MTRRTVFCPVCNSTETYFQGYDDGYEGELLFGIAEMWKCEDCSNIFEIGEAEEEWDSDFDLNDTDDEHEQRTN